MARVGIVDDNRELCTLMARSLHQHHEIVCFHDGVHALRELPAWHPDIVVMDVCLDERMDGFACMSRLKSQGVNSRFLVITGYQPFDMAPKARDHGAHAFLSKPFAAVELRQTIDTLLWSPPGAHDFKIKITPESRPLPYSTPHATASLTGRETEVLKQLDVLKSAKNVAAHLAISRRTVEAHLQNIYHKLHVRDWRSALRQFFGGD